MTDKEKLVVEGIAEREDRDRSETMRSLLKLGVEAYLVTGNLYEKDVLPGETQPEPADELAKEQRRLAEEFTRFSDALDKIKLKMQSLFSKEKQKKERGNEWQQAQHKSNK